MAIHVGIEIQSGDVVFRSTLQPDRLPDSTARSIEDVTRVKSLLADRNNIIARVSGIMHKDKPVFVTLVSSSLSIMSREISQFILLATLHVLGDIQSKTEVPSTVKPGFLAVDKNCGLIVHSLEVQKNTLPVPVRGNCEQVGVPRVQIIVSLNTFCKVSASFTKYLGVSYHQPDNPLSRQNGTSTSCARFCPNGGFSTSFRLEAFSYCQTPLRFCH